MYLVTGLSQYRCYHNDLAKFPEGPDDFRKGHLNKTHKSGNPREEDINVTRSKTFNYLVTAGKLRYQLSLTQPTLCWESLFYVPVFYFMFQAFLSLP